MPEALLVPSLLRPWIKAGLGALLLESEERAQALRVPGDQQKSPSPPPKAFSTRQSPPASAPKNSPGQANPPPHPLRPNQPSAVRPAGPAEGFAASVQAAQAAQNRKKADLYVPSAPDHAEKHSPLLSDRQTPRSPERQATQAPTVFAEASAEVSAESFGEAAALPPQPSLPPIILPLDKWPAAWLALKNRKPLPPQPKVFWTYAGLGDDLMGTADPARQAVVVRLLSSLRHPGGTHVFWPYTLPSTASVPTGNAPSLFWSGVEVWRPGVILLFGSDARDALGLPSSLLPFSQQRINSRLVVQLPRPASMFAEQSAAQNPEPEQATGQGDAALRRAQAFLSRLLSFCQTPQ